MSCLSLAQVMIGGGTLSTSHGSVTSSPTFTDISNSLPELFCISIPPTPLSLGFTKRLQRHTVLQVQQDEFGRTKLINRKQTNKVHTEIMKTQESKSQKTGKTEQSK